MPRWNVSPRSWRWRKLRSCGSTSPDASLPCPIRNKPPELAAWLLAQLDSPVVQRPVLRGLASFDHPDIPATIVAGYPTLGDLAARRDALQTLASRAAWAGQLLDAVEAGRIARSDLTAFTTRQIQNLGDPELSKRIVSLWGAVTSTPAELQPRIDDHVRNLADELDEANLPAGRQLYRTHCAAFHLLFGEGGEFGPDLTGAQRSDVGYLVEHILAPSTAVARDYQMQIVELDDGRTLTGLFSAETETTVTIRTLNEEAVTPRAKIREQTASPVSIMPEGLLDQLTETQIRDLIGYLGSPKQVPLPAE